MRTPVQTMTTRTSRSFRKRHEPKPAIATIAEVLAKGSFKVVKRSNG